MDHVVTEKWHLFAATSALAEGHYLTGRDQEISDFTPLLPPACLYTSKAPEMTSMTLPDSSTFFRAAGRGLAHEFVI
jgi:hypothetical protein